MAGKIRTEGAKFIPVEQIQNRMTSDFKVNDKFAGTRASVNRTS